MSTFEQEKERVGQYNHVVLLTYNNSDEINAVLGLKHFNLDSKGLNECHLETLARNIDGSARILAIIDGKISSMNRKKFYYGKLIDAKEFRDKALANNFAYHIGGPNWFEEQEKLKEDLDKFFKGEYDPD